MKRRNVRAASKTSGKLLLITCCQCGREKPPYTPDTCRECFEEISARTLRNHFRSNPP